MAQRQSLNYVLKCSFNSKQAAEAVIIFWQEVLQRVYQAVKYPFMCAGLVMPCQPVSMHALLQNREFKGSFWRAGYGEYRNKSHPFYIYACTWVLLWLALPVLDK